VGGDHAQWRSAVVVALANARARGDVLGGGRSDVGVGDVSKGGCAREEGGDRAGEGFLGACVVFWVLGSLSSFGAWGMVVFGEGGRGQARVLVGWGWARRLCTG
jgi:hypothetical protein